MVVQGNSSWGPRHFFSQQVADLKTGTGRELSKGSWIFIWMAVPIFLLLHPCFLLTVDIKQRFC